MISYYMALHADLKLSGRRLDILHRPLPTCPCRTALLPPPPACPSLAPLSARASAADRILPKTGRSNQRQRATRSARASPPRQEVERQSYLRFGLSLLRLCRCHWRRSVRAHVQSVRPHGAAPCQYPAQPLAPPAEAAAQLWRKRGAAEPWLLTAASWDCSAVGGQEGR